MWRHTGSSKPLGPASSGAAPGPRGGGVGGGRASVAAAVTCLLVAGMLVLSVGHGSGAEPGAVGGEGTPAGDGRAFSAYFRRLARERRAVRGPQRSSVTPGPTELLTPGDLFLAVKTTGRFHRPRMDLLLDTWISRNMQQTYVFTDGEDEELRGRMGSHLINTNCSAAHSRQALSCKMSLEYDAFMSSGRKWFCHVDDDNYVNAGALLNLLSRFRHADDVYIGRPSLERPIEATERVGAAHAKQVRFWFATGGAGFCLSRGLALKMKPWASSGSFLSTAERIRLPDDCAVGYIVDALLGVRLVRSPLFHSHLENLGMVADIHNQVTLSYGAVDTNRNTVNVKGPFKLSEDPTRFRSVHCLLYPDTPWCHGPWRP